MNLWENKMTNEQLENINKTLLKQRDDAELKLAQLVRLIEDDIWCCMDRKTAKIVEDAMKKIGV